MTGSEKESYRLKGGFLLPCSVDCVARPIHERLTMTKTEAPQVADPRPIFEQRSRSLATLSADLEHAKTKLSDIRASALLGESANVEQAEAAVADLVSQVAAEESLVAGLDRKSTRLNSSHDQI